MVNQILMVFDLSKFQIENVALKLPSGYYWETYKKGYEKYFKFVKEVENQ